MSEWSIEHAWKACVLKGTEGSNPSLSAGTLANKIARNCKSPSNTRLTGFLLFNAFATESKKTQILAFFASVKRARKISEITRSFCGVNLR